MFDINWFPKWNRDNPTDIYGPAILIGAIGAAIIAAAVVISWGNPAQTTSVQTGFRGIGMSVTGFPKDAGAIDPALEEYHTEPVIKPTGSEPLAKDVYQNVQVLGDLTEDNFNRVMNAITQWVSPEQGCAYCHEGENLAEDKLYTKVVARRMIQMTQALNADWGEHVGQTGVNCHTCHRGQNVPSNIWFRLDPQLEAVSGWSANQNYATQQTVSTSLPHDALQKLLVEGAEIKVHDLEPRVDNKGTASIQDTERTYSLMNHFANSLGVNCVFCHNSRAFYDAEQVTPQWSKAAVAIEMVRELNNDYLNPLKDAYPPERLGPKHADAPKAACSTCHQGQRQPLGGRDMVSDWPELQQAGAPKYE